MRPKLHADTCYISVREGVFLRRNNHRLLLKGKSLYQLIDHLAPHLNGDATLEEITAGLDEKRKRMVINLIEKLQSHHFLKDSNQDHPSTIPSPLQATYHSDIAFIDAIRPSATAQFEQFRNTRLLIIGSEPALTALIQAGLQCGVRRITMITASEQTHGSHPPVVSPDLVSPGDAEQTVQAIEAPCWDHEDELITMIQGYDALVHIFDQPMLARAQRLNRLCIEQQKIAIQAVVVDAHAWIGPLVSPNVAGCWECAWRRLQSNCRYFSNHCSRYTFDDHPALPPNNQLTPNTAALIANRLLFTLFTDITQAGSTKTMIDLDLETLQSRSHTFLPHPHCRACQRPGVPTASHFLERLQHLQTRGPIEPEEFFAEITRCIDDRLGLLQSVDTNAFVQVPLALYQANLSNPLFPEHPHDKTRVIAVGMGAIQARLQALQQACLHYAATLIDRRRLLTRETVQEQPQPAIASNQLVASTVSDAEVEAWTWALDLSAHQARIVPVTPLTQGLGTDLGIAAGTTWEEAICRALLNWCQFLTVRQIAESQQEYRLVDLTKAPMTTEGTHLYHLLIAANQPVIVYDVTGPLRIPTFAICVDKLVIAYSTHCDSAQALSTGLAQALQHYQSKLYQQPEYALTPVPDLPVDRRSEQWSVPSYTFPETWPDRLTWLIQILAANRLEAFAVPLDHDPALVQVLPYLVRVLLLRMGVKHG